MKKIIIPALALFLLGLGCATMMSFEEREKTYGKEGPVISETFASKQMKPGDTWRIYLKASDPGGDLYQIVALVNQPGFGFYSPSLTKIREGNGKELDGYIYLNTQGPYDVGWQNFLSLSVTIQIQDRAGHFSEPVTFPLSFQNRYTQDPPPPGKFKEQSLGPIMVVLRDPATGGQSDSFF